MYYDTPWAYLARVLRVLSAYLHTFPTKPSPPFVRLFWYRASYTLIQPDTASHAHMLPRLFA